ncbi:DUF28-domain-containing protein [Crepidotus variabilis]|uniref:DUF28-domain-containing protein n=1 Tax=Crepidotus variabilis TaxID=179855 RepID=A0A9P6EKU1_9AGAR|nr:DUF28-domain-containing protein [Crepidotus variabilis]
MLLATLSVRQRARALLPVRYFSATAFYSAGHNKWSKIKDKKGANDLQKSVMYSKASHEILSAARMGGSSDPAQNAQLSAALKKAKDLGVPKENIERALARASGTKEGLGNKMVYEALAFDSVGLMIECWTDNANRTLHNIREVLTSRGARMAPVKFMFERLGRVTVSMDANAPNPSDLEDKIFEIGLSHGATDLPERPDLSSSGRYLYEFVCKPEDVNSLAEVMKLNVENEDDLEVQVAEIVYMPSEQQDLEEAELKHIKELVDALEADGDTSRVWTTASISTAS